MSSQEDELKKTVLYDWHVSAGAKTLGFGGFDMPIQYKTIFSEHIATRMNAGLFDISHMGRFFVSGGDAIPFLQYLTTNNALALNEVGKAQYTLIPDENGGAIDDAYLYRVGQGEYMLVVNAANREKDWQWLDQFRPKFPNIVFTDKSEDLAMMALQGPKAALILEEILGLNGNSGRLPEPFKNMLSFVRINGSAVIVARTGYTGEPVGFELFSERSNALPLWEQILKRGEGHGVVPVGLGARDTLRLEFGLPLYGHELGEDPNGDPIPICALSLGRKSTSFAVDKGDYIGKGALIAQNEEVVERLRAGGKFTKPFHERVVPRFIRQIAILNGNRTGPGISSARQGDEVYLDESPVGWVTSGTIVPYLRFGGSGLYSAPGEAQDRRAIAIAYIDSAIVSGKSGQFLEIRKSRSRFVPAIVVRSNLEAAPPYSRVIIHPEARRFRYGVNQLPGAEELSARAVENTKLRQSGAINLIPSEQTPSRFVRLLSILDPAARYAEHKTIKAFGKVAKDVFYYQGTGFIEWVEEAAQAVLRAYLGCSEVEVRPVSGQMANKSVFSGLVDYMNRFGRGEPERLGYVISNHLGRGGHLSAQYMGALRHFVRHDSRTERPAVVHFPVQEDNPYRIDVEKTKTLIEEYSPQLAIFGKSMVLHPEPVKEIAAFAADREDRPILMYDMAHVLGLVGPHFQKPFEEGADIVTGSTHKTFFGPQRGVIASRMSESTFYRPLWERIVTEVFPGDVSNHHLGTLLALLGASYEMMAFKDDYQARVMANAKAFARALSESGLSVEGDPSVDYTETHQVILNVGRGKGAEVARRLEENNVITNYQALPGDVSFSDASGIRLGVQEMTRFGMQKDDFQELAGYMSDIILKNRGLGGSISKFREKFTAMRFCLPVSEDLIAAALGAA